ncbi:PH domain-containing protein [uncultured Stenotrophomonas sp.]|uniref:PH domain-containing protein n=1 Tax=uncultured Stenotrophomonas sp. TaxID=165438 RepID=UPI0028EEDFD1|nr:PH domain-containing protein [uncultured Stenotrophomonas sp.]
MSDLSPPPLPLPQSLPEQGHWQPLPRRAATLAGIAGAVTGAIVIGGALGTLWVVLDMPMRWLGAVAMLLPGALIGGFFGYRRQRRTWWRLDAQGLGVRRDLMWQLETRVPLSRVQHLDLRRGPIERTAQLATLVVHTAGSRFSAVSLGGLDQADAERLRDTLGRQLDQDDDAL